MENETKLQAETANNDKANVMQSLILASLKERAKVYQNNYYGVGLDEVEREGWYASWKAMDEAIYIVEHALSDERTIK